MDAILVIFGLIIFFDLFDVITGPKVGSRYKKSENND